MYDTCDNCKFCSGTGLETRTTYPRWINYFWEKPVTTKHKIITCARYPAHRNFIFSKADAWHWCGEYEREEENDTV